MLSPSRSSPDRSLPGGHSFRKPGSSEPKRPAGGKKPRGIAALFSGTLKAQLCPSQGATEATGWTTDSATGTQRYFTVAELDTYTTDTVPFPAEDDGTMTCAAAPATPPPAEPDPPTLADFTAEMPSKHL